MKHLFTYRLFESLAGKVLTNLDSVLEGFYIVKKLKLGQLSDLEYKQLEANPKFLGEI